MDIQNLFLKSRVTVLSRLNTQATTVQKVHGGRMQSADKNDIYQRTKTHHGTIGKDGLVLRGKTTANDKLIKLGKK